MTRKYRLRQREVELEEFPDVIAVYGNVDAEPAEAIQGQEAFETAGWRFVRRDSYARTAARVPSAAVYRRRPSGQLILDRNRAVVKFEESVGREHIDAVLREHGARIVESVPIAENLFIVEIDRGMDALDAVAALGKLPIVQFAEPEFLEAMTSR